MKPPLGSILRVVKLVLNGFGVFGGKREFRAGMEGELADGACGGVFVPQNGPARGVEQRLTDVGSWPRLVIETEQHTVVGPASGGEHLAGEQVEQVVLGGPDDP